MGAKGPGGYGAITCPSKFQKLAEPEPLEAEVAPPSILHMRVVRELTFCSIFWESGHLGSKSIDDLFNVGNQDVRRTTELVMVWMWLS